MSAFTTDGLGFFRLTTPAPSGNAGVAVDSNFGNASTLITALQRVFGGSGTNHFKGLVPDPGATAGATKYLREDGTWAIPSGGGGGSLPADAAGLLSNDGNGNLDWDNTSYLASDGDGSALTGIAYSQISGTPDLSVYAMTSDLSVYALDSVLAALRFDHDGLDAEVNILIAKVAAQASVAISDPTDLASVAAAVQALIDAAAS